MSMIALVTGADRGLGRALTESLLERGWIVVAGQHIAWTEHSGLVERFPSNFHIVPIDISSDESIRDAKRAIENLVPHLDLLIANAAINRSHNVKSIRQDLNFDDMIDEININSIGALRSVQAFLPLMDKGTLKRLCFVSSEAGSVEASQRTGWFGYCMSKAALNMGVKNLSNDLSGDGYTFRLYHPGWLKTYMSGTKNVNAAIEPEEGAGLALNYFLDQDEPEALALHSFDGTEMPW